MMHMELSRILPLFVPDDSPAQIQRLFPTAERSQLLEK